MHIVKFAFECGGFDYRLKRGGMSTLVWNLARKYVEYGHDVSLITPMHGYRAYLQERYKCKPTPYSHDYRMPLVLDPKVWPSFPSTIDIPLTTSAHHARVDGVNVYFLANEFLDALAERLYPPRAYEGVDLLHFKSLIFQVDGIEFIRRFFHGQNIVIQAYEPYYHYLLPVAFHKNENVRVISTVASNAPVNRKVYQPQVESLLEALSIFVDLTNYADEMNDDEIVAVMRQFMPETGLDTPSDPNYICLFSLIADFCDRIDFLTEGQMTFYSTFRGTPFERLFKTYKVSEVIKNNVHKQFVGGCGISDDCLRLDPSSIDRATVLTSLGLRPGRPTFYHAARYSLEDKGQLEMMRAIDRVLSVNQDVNFIIRCSVGTGANRSPTSGNSYFEEIARKYPGHVYLDWSMVEERVLFDHASAADFCIFPSKLELDTFLIAQGEAMACGAVPVATAQESTSFYGHTFDASAPDATGFAVSRSFRVDDSLLTEALTGRIWEALKMFRHSPAEYRRLSNNARNMAHSFSWRRAAEARLEVFEQLKSGAGPVHSEDVNLRYGWFDRLSEQFWLANKERIADAALAQGNFEVYRRSASVTIEMAVALHQQAYTRADFMQCQLLWEAIDRPESIADVNDRCRITVQRDLCFVEYWYPHAVRVECFFLALGNMEDGHRVSGPLCLVDDAGTFRGTAPRAVVGEHVVFLLTLPRGQFAWDAVRLTLQHPVAVARRGTS